MGGAVLLRLLEQLPDILPVRNQYDDDGRQHPEHGNRLSPQQKCNDGQEEDTGEPAQLIAAGNEKQHAKNGDNDSKG